MGDFKREKGTVFVLGINVNMCAKSENSTQWRHAEWRRSTEGELGLLPGRSGTSLWGEIFGTMRRAPGNGSGKAAPGRAENTHHLSGHHPTSWATPHLRNPKFKVFFESVAITLTPRSPALVCITSIAFKSICVLLHWPLISSLFLR